MFSAATVELFQKVGQGERANYQLSISLSGKEWCYVVAALSMARTQHHWDPGVLTPDAASCNAVDLSAFQEEFLGLAYHLRREIEERLS